MATIEDLILFKLQSWRPQDQVDVARLLRETRSVDRSYVESWLDRVAADSGAPMIERWPAAQAIDLGEKR